MPSTNDLHLLMSFTPSHVTMKRILVLSLFFGLFSSLFAQKSAIHFLGELPDPPNACSLLSEQKQEYLLSLEALASEIQAELQNRKKVQDAHVARNKDKWEKLMGKQAGMSEAQMAKLKAAKGKMSKEEKRKLADEAMQERANLSLEEAEKLKKMDKAARQAWAKAYAAEMMATMQSQTPEERAKMLEEQTRLMKLAKLTQDQQEMIRQNNADAAALQARMHELDEEAREEYAEKIKPIEDQIADKKDELRSLNEEMSKCATNECREDYEKKITEVLKRIGELEKQKNRALKSYCAQFSGQYADLVRRYLSWARQAAPGFDRYEEMENEKWKLQTDDPENVFIVQIGEMGMQQAATCASLLLSVFKYRLFKGEYADDDSDAAQGAEG